MIASIDGTSQPRVSVELPRIIFAEVPLQDVPRCVTSSSPVAKHTDVLFYGGTFLLALASDFGGPAMCALPA
jgi:hypothetical protein